MLAKARRYLDTAEVLRRYGDYDSAVSRLYYAMFYCAQALLRAQGMTYTKRQAVIAAFGRHFAKTEDRRPRSCHPNCTPGYTTPSIADR